MTNCKNCGAPLKAGQCEYCGTELPGIVRSKMDITSSGIHIECSAVNFVPVDPIPHRDSQLIAMYRGRFM